MDELNWFEKSQLTGRFRRHTRQQKEFVWSLRDHPTPAETALWKILQKKQLGGFKFRKQHRIGPYIADFYCHSASLVIEVDGAIHLQRQEYDTHRTQWLNSIGVTVIRFKNEAVLNNPEQVKREIIKALEKLKGHTSSA